MRIYKICLLLSVSDNVTFKLNSITFTIAFLSISIVVSSKLISFICVFTIFSRDAVSELNVMDSSGNVCTVKSTSNI